MARDGRRVVCILLAAALAAAGAGGAEARPRGDPDFLAGCWPEQRVQELLGRTLELRLAVDLGTLANGERDALRLLLRVGALFQDLYERSQHHQAADVRGRLLAGDPRGQEAYVRGLLDLYRLFQGPVATTLDNLREPFLPVDGPAPGRHFYPWGVARAELDEEMARHPESAAELTHLRTLVRRVAPAELRRDLAALERHPALAALHPGLRARLQGLLSAPAGRRFYAVPYAVGYADEIVEASALLHDAARLVAADDPDFADYLRQRSRDLLTDDYEAGDAAWVSGRFGRLNAQIGAYETYDDALYGVKASFSLSLLLRDEERTRAIAGAVSGLQALEDALPSRTHQKVRSAIPVAVYDVVADFGQARGTNTATILPNESHLTRKYGRTILLRKNILASAELFELARAEFAAALAPRHHGELGLHGNLDRTLWHEIGHYLGPKNDRRGRTLGQALEEHADLLEELKSDLVALFAAERNHAAGLVDGAGLRAIQAAGVLRVLQKVKPRREQPYQTMQLMQWNWFLEHGLLVFDAAAGLLAIDHARYPQAVAGMLEKVLALQEEGDKAAAGRFIETYAFWKDELHGRVAAAMRDAETVRFRLVRYAVLGE